MNYFVECNQTLNILNAGKLYIISQLVYQFTIYSGGGVFAYFVLAKLTTLYVTNSKCVCVVAILQATKESSTYGFAL